MHDLGIVTGAEHGEALEEEEEEEDDETCGFCIFMKAGGCKNEFNVRNSPAGFVLADQRILLYSKHLCAFPWQRSSFDCS